MVLDRCHNHGIMISSQKFDLDTSIKFGSYIMMESRVKPDLEKVAVMKNFPVPTNMQELQSFPRLGNQLSQFIPDLPQATDNMCRLLKKGIAFCGWKNTSAILKL